MTFSFEGKTYTMADNYVNFLGFSYKSGKKRQYINSRKLTGILYESSLSGNASNKAYSISKQLAEALKQNFPFLRQVRGQALQLRTCYHTMPNIRHKPDGYYYGNQQCNKGPSDDGLRAPDALRRRLIETSVAYDAQDKRDDPGYPAMQEHNARKDQDPNHPFLREGKGTVIRQVGLHSIRSRQRLCKVRQIHKGDSRSHR